MDKYDRAIELLQQSENFLEDVVRAWINADAGDTTGCLFQYAGEINSYYGYNGTSTGCLTMIRKHPATRSAATKDLTEGIINDARIPKEYTDITPECLPVFADWQRRLDREIRNQPTVQESDPQPDVVVG